MDNREHLKLPLFKGNVERRKPPSRGGFSLPSGRSKGHFAQKSSQKADELITSFSKLKKKFPGMIDPSLIYEIEINQSVHAEGIEKIFSSMGIHVLSVAEGKKGFWIVFNDNDNLDTFKNNLEEYGKPLGKYVPEEVFASNIISLENSKYIREYLKTNNVLNANYYLVKENAKIFCKIEKVRIPLPDNMLPNKAEIVKALKGYHTGNYDFFNAIESFQNIPIDKKIGQSLKENPLGNRADFIDIELWKMSDPKKNETFIQQLKDTYTDFSQFRITDTLITKSFVLLRIKLTKAVFDEIIELNEIARADRSSLPHFNPFEFMRPDISDIEFSEPAEDATGILIIDSGIISNHPMLEKCVGGEENFQSGETELHDTVGHGTAVSGCAAYGNIENSLENKSFNPENWIFSAKVMYAERDFNGNIVKATYDPEKLVEHQFQDAVESFLSNSDYHIKIVNISLGNSNEVWHKHYSRQRPFAALIDELALTFPDVTFIVSAGNQRPQSTYDTIQEIVDNYPAYLTENEYFKIINPATSALALTIGSIAGPIRITEERYGVEDIKTPIAKENQPSPFTRTGNGINGMIKPEFVEYGGNLILAETHSRITEDIGGKIALLNNTTTEDIVRYDYGTSYAAPKVAYLAGKISNKFPQKSANFIKNMLLIGSDYPFIPDDFFYGSIPKSIGEKKFIQLLENIEKKTSIDNKNCVYSAFLFRQNKKKKSYCLKFDTTYEKKKEIAKIFKEVGFKTDLAMRDHLSVNGYGLSNFEKAINSYKNRTVLWDEGELGLNQIKVYSLQLPEIFFNAKGKKRITVALTFNPETRLTRGDSYLGNRMEFHLFYCPNR